MCEIRRRRIGGHKDAGSLLAAQMQSLAGADCTVTMKRERPWASITFSGTRHTIEIDCSQCGGQEQAQRLAAILPDHEFDLQGFFVADLLIKEITGAIIKLEALTIIDPVGEPRC